MSRWSSPVPAISRSRANSRMVTLIALPRRSPFHVVRARQCLPARVFVVGVGRGPFDPDLAALEQLALPDRRDLLDALDRVAARGKRIGAMRRGGGDHHARLADAERSDAMR